MIIQSKLQTKDWRTSQSWYKNGKSNECEIYQRILVESITSLPCRKCNFRINIRKNTLEEKTNPLKYQDGFDWTEDFDGIQEKSGKTLYYNLKMICDSGGAQTRALREVNHFVEAQLKYLLKNHETNIIFINILDGDTSYGQQDKFEYLINLPEYTSVKNKIYVGDMLSFQEWFKIHFAIDN